MTAKDVSEAEFWATRFAQDVSRLRDALRRLRALAPFGCAHPWTQDWERYALWDCDRAMQSAENVRFFLKAER